jgi:nitrogen fixation protein FixH
MTDTHTHAEPPMRKRFTGKHMTLILVAFFGVVISVNVFMAKMAISGFGGTVVDNSYVASQHYNEWLAEGRRQQALGWTADITLNGERRLVLAASDREGTALDNVAVTARAEHPVGLVDPIDLRLDRTEAGTFIADRPLPRGRWAIKLTIARGEDRLELIEDIR